MKVTIKDWGKGLNKDQPAWELAPGYWSDCTNMRFRNGKAERMGGIASINTPSITPYWMHAYSSGTTRYLVYAGLTKAYSYDGTTETEITRGAASATVSALSKATTKIVTVTTATAHGLSSGNTVTIFGVKSSTNSKGLNGAFVITVSSSTVFTYTASSSNAVAYTPSATELAAIGYTIGLQNFTITADNKITGGNANGVLVYNNPVDGLYYWDQLTAGKLVPMAAYSGNLADAARHFKDYIVLIAPTVSGTKYSHAILWSSSADPGTVPLYFTASATNDAGQQDCVSEREAIDGLEWGDTFQLYKGDCRFSISYIGGDFVFDFRGASVYCKDDGLLAANCVVNTPKGQVFVSGSLDIRIHQGGESTSLVQGRMLDSFRSRIDSTNRKRTFVEINPYANEVWVCFPESGQSVCTKALVWNWNDDTWGERDLANVTCACSGFLPTTIVTGSRMMVGTSSPKTGLVDSGLGDFGNAFNSMLERTGMDFDSYNLKTLHQSMPKIAGASGLFTASIYHGSTGLQDGQSVTYTAPMSYAEGLTDRVSGFAPSGRYLAWKMVVFGSAFVDSNFTLRSIDFWFNEDGEY